MSNLHTAKCARCKKVFYLTSEHVYKEHGKLFCSWSCLCAHRREKEEKRKPTGRPIKNRDRDIEIAKLHKQGFTGKQIAEIYKLSYEATLDAIKRGYKYLEDEKK